MLKSLLSRKLNLSDTDLYLNSASKEESRKDQGSCQTIFPPSVNLHLLQTERQLFLWGEAAGRYSPSALPPRLSTHFLHLSIKHHPSLSFILFPGADTRPSRHPVQPCTAFVSHLITSHLQCKCNIPTRTSFLLLEVRKVGNVWKHLMCCSLLPMGRTESKEGMFMFCKPAA